MRAIIFILITSLSLSSLANAAMLCCWDMDNETAQSEMSPCHEMNQSDTAEAEVQDPETLDCECDSCLQKSFVQPGSLTAQSLKANLDPHTNKDLPSLVPEPLYTPPILNS